MVLITLAFVLLLYPLARKLQQQSQENALIASLLLAPFIFLFPFSDVMTKYFNDVLIGTFSSNIAIWLSRTIVIFIGVVAMFLIIKIIFVTADTFLTKKGDPIVRNTRKKLKKTTNKLRKK